MATMKEYGLILEDESVKIAEVIVNKSQFESFCVVELRNELDNKLQSLLKAKKMFPITIIPDTALYSCNFRESIIRDASNEEKEEYLLNYYDNYQSQ